MTERVLVTGGAGFIGSHVAKTLQSEGFSVRVLDSLVTGRRDNIHDGIKFFEGDIRNESAVDEAMEGVSGVFHLAANVGNIKSIEQPVLDAEVNVEGTVRVLEAAQEHGVSDFVYSSSAATFGPVEYTPVDEAHPQNPESPYGVTKLAGEKHAMCYSKLYDLNVIALRYFNVYGRNQYYDEYGNVIPIWTNRLLDENSLIIYGDGKQTRDFVNVRDIAKANLRAFETDVGSEVYNIGTGKATEIKDLAESLLEVADSDVQIEHKPPREGEVRHSVADISKAKRELGYAPDISLEKGMVEYVDWLKNNR